MSKEKFREARLSNSNLEKVSTINQIIEEYSEDGYTLTLRQLYYQLVSRDLIPNCDKEYKKLSNILKEARMGGLVDWSAIEDRIRKPRLPYWVSGIDDALSDTIKQYRLNRMHNQDSYIEVWVEKDALSEVLSRVTRRFHVKIMVNRGYSSASAMYDAAKRFLLYPERHKYIIYLGDHDPSGLDMVRDIKDRLLEFGCNVTVDNIALTMDQIHELNPPPNPAKVKDPRAGWYIEKFGPISWELDALDPEYLNALLTDALVNYIDIGKFEEVCEQEIKDIEKLKSLTNDRG